MIRESFIKFLESLNIAEIGLGGGDNALKMLKTLPYARFVFVDSYDVNNPTFQFDKHIFSNEERDEFISKVKEKLSPYNDRVQIVIKDSMQASEDFPDGHFDYIYIDAEHDKLSVLKDLMAWFPKLKRGGIISGHDCTVEGVKAAVNEFLQKTEFFMDDWMMKK